MCLTSVSSNTAEANRRTKLPTNTWNGLAPTLLLAYPNGVGWLRRGNKERVSNGKDFSKRSGAAGYRRLQDSPARRVGGPLKRAHPRHRQNGDSSARRVGNSTIRQRW